MFERHLVHVSCLLTRFSPGHLQSRTPEPQMHITIGRRKYIKKMWTPCHIYVTKKQKSAGNTAARGKQRAFSIPKNTCRKTPENTGKKKRSAGERRSRGRDGDSGASPLRPRPVPPYKSNPAEERKQNTKQPVHENVSTWKSGLPPPDSTHAPI